MIGCDLHPPYLTLLSGCSNGKTEDSKKKNNKSASPTVVTAAPTPVVTLAPTPTPMPEYPEPYIKAVEKFNSGDLDMALKYLDMAIQDFPTKEVKLKANIIKGHIYNIRAYSLGSVFMSYAKGATEYLNSPFMDESGRLDVIKSQL